MFLKGDEIGVLNLGLIGLVVPIFRQTLLNNSPASKQKRGVFAPVF